MKQRELIRNRRIEKGLTEIQVAQFAGITQGAYSHIESGRRNPSIKVAKRLAKVLEMDWTEFFRD